jgi:hypothetical protein
MDYDLNLEDEHLEKQQTKEILETELTKASISLYFKSSVFLYICTREVS